MDFVLAEICSSSSEEEEGAMRTIMTIPLALLPVQDQGGEQHAFCYELHKVKLISFNNPCNIIFLHGEGHNFFGPYNGEGYSFSAGSWGGGRGMKKISLGKKIAPAPPLPTSAHL